MFSSTACCPVKCAGTSNPTAGKRGSQQTKTGVGAHPAVGNPSENYSHFISLPLASHPAFVKQVEKFHASVMRMIPVINSDTSSSSSLTSGHGIDESILINPKTLHFTLLMLKLGTEERVATAVEVLQGLHSKLLEALNYGPIAVRLKGLECLVGTPAKAHVLYARVEDAEQEKRLLYVCKIIKEEFVKAGLVPEKDKKQQIKLHATLMNTSYRKKRKGDKQSGRGQRIPFDATDILAKHGSEEWGEYRITEAHLSQRFVYDKDGYYHCCASLKFPALHSNPQRPGRR